MMSLSSTAADGPVRALSVEDIVAPYIAGEWVADGATDGALELGFWEQPDGEDVSMILRIMSDGTLRQVDSGATWRRE